jgi:polar amino acid transport system substrate-binding protein
MNRTTRHARRVATLIVAAFGISAALAGCSAGGGTSPAIPGVPRLAPVPSAVALLPADLKKSGTLQVAIPTNEPPTQFYRAGTSQMTGVNPDIARLIASALGLKIQIDVTAFDGIIPGMSAGRYDLTVSSMTPTHARMKVLDFVDYAQMGSALAVAKGNPESIGFETLCGKKVAVLQGSYQLTVNIPEVDKKCKAAAKPAPQIFQFNDTHQAISSVVSGRTDVVYADSPIIGYAVKQEPRVGIAGQNDFAPVSVGIPRDSHSVRAVAAALKAIITTPEYKKVLASYGLSSMAITDARVNAAQG